MGDVTGIAWTDHTANFWWGCQKVSSGCEHCYAETLAVTRRKLDVWGPPKTTDRKRMKGVWTDVVKWNDAAKRDGVRRRMFVSSMADIFEDHPQVAPWRTEALALLASCTSLDVQLLTKRPQNIREMVSPSWLKSWPDHVWIGCTVEDQKRASERIPHLLKVPARVRFLSCEPLLESVSLTRLGLEPDHHEKSALVARNGRWGTCVCCPRDDEGSAYPERCEFTARYDHNITGWLSWVIVGGESGPGARRFDIAWARSIVEQCDAARVPVFVKQMGDNCTMGGNMECDRVRLRAHHGADPSEWPRHLQRQEFPR